jgi:hypothetical protein
LSNKTSENIHCPNCKEDVPKTLYCLNCGYPLYKLEQPTKVEMKEVEPTLEPEPEDVDMSVEIELPEPMESIVESESVPKEEESLEAFEEGPMEIVKDTMQVEQESELESGDELLPESEIETAIVVEEDYEQVEDKQLQEPEQEKVMEEPLPELEEEVDEPELESGDELLPEPEIETAIVVEEDSEQVEDKQLQEPEQEKVMEEPLPELEEEVDEPELDVGPYIGPEPEQGIESEVEIDLISPLERESYLMNDIKVEFAPDPLTKEVMESLAKNITLKIRIVRLLRESQVKEETFNKLFDSYVEQGRLWVGRRDEIIRRLKTDIERMEQALVTARKDFELLEIRKSIGDASNEEYNVKAPAYKWDIENLDNEIKNTRGGIQYVSNLKGLIPEEEIGELRDLADSDYSKLEDVEGVTSDTIARMKESLTEALKSIES